MIDNLPEKIYIQDFRTLTVWKKSTVLAQKMYKIVKFFPEIEKYIMVSQILRCSTSISANLAEGNSQLYKKKEISFANNALGSAGETKHWRD